MKSKMTFHEFYDKCEKLYERYKPHFFLQGCDIITNFEGNEIERGCWYCIVKIREHVYTVLAYDHSDDGEDKPFVVNCDWSFVATAKGSFHNLGYFAECEEFDNLEEAFYYMVKEPSRYYLNSTNIVNIIERGKPEDVYAWKEGCSLIEGIDFLKDHKDWFSGKTMQIVQLSTWGETVLYERTF